MSIDTQTATYTDDGRIYIDNFADLATFDAGGGEWREPVKGILREYGYEPVGDWQPGQHDYDPATIQVRPATSEPR